VTFLLGVPPRIIGSVTITMFVTPSKLGTMLRCSPIPLSNGARVLPRITLAPWCSGQRFEGLPTLGVFGHRRTSPSTIVRPTQITS
jgi:hypothetical protein